MSLVFERADPVADHDTLVLLNIEYLNWAAKNIDEAFGMSLADLLGLPIPEYVEGALEKLCEGTPPSGVFYLVRNNGAVAGMGGLRTVKPGIVEMKRVYVLPNQRGGGLGAKITQRLVEDAKLFGHREMWLDTGPFMTSAHRLYESLGFRDIPAYPEAEVPEELHQSWRFMARSL